MVMPNNERIDRALRHLRDGLRPKCEDTWQGFFGDDWLDQVNQKLHNPERKPTTEDAAFLFKRAQGDMEDIFSHAFSPRDFNYVHELAEARNKWAHQGTFLQTTHFAISTPQSVSSRPSAIKTTGSRFRSSVKA